jgi:hypothetical protein
MFVSCDCCLLSRGHGIGPITRPEEYYWVWCVWAWSRSLVNGGQDPESGRSAKGKKIIQNRSLAIVLFCCNQSYWQLQTGLEGGRNKRKWSDTVAQLILQSILAKNWHIQEHCNFSCPLSCTALCQYQYLAAAVTNMTYKSQHSTYNQTQMLTVTSGYEAPEYCSQCEWFIIVLSQQKVPA